MFLVIPSLRCVQFSVVDKWFQPFLLIFVQSHVVDHTLYTVKKNGDISFKLSCQYHIPPEVWNKIILSQFSFWLYTVNFTWYCTACLYKTTSCFVVWANSDNRFYDMSVLDTGTHYQCSICLIAISATHGVLQAGSMYENEKYQLHWQ